MTNYQTDIVAWANEQARLVFWSICLVLMLCTPYAAYAEYAWDLLKQPTFKTIYLKTLGTKAKVKWLAKLSGPSSPNTQRMVGTLTYQFAHTCKPHACGTDHLALAYHADSKRLYLKLTQETGVQWLGEPSAEMKLALDSYDAGDK
ncbi:MAG: Ivy family c-type lysozyme inhibitor [Gallionella sp.]|nr:Ivy family c-type lysozyme inhibitor [Gallionella sp.]MDD4958738.1 Ivy family c-type lysozyme inhibitor [Gallionella sp.]